MVSVMPTQRLWPSEIPVVRVWILQPDLSVAGPVQPEERPADVTVMYGKNGKPMLPNTDEHLSFADSNDLALVALSSRTQVGVDLEAIPDRTTCEEIAPLYATVEQAWLRSSPSHLRPERFTKLWCRKEAVGKLHGHGPEAASKKSALSTSARSFADAGWTVHDFRPANGYLASVAMSATPATIRIARPDTWEAPWPGNTGSPVERKCQGEIDALVC